MIPRPGVFLMMAVAVLLLHGTAAPRVLAFSIEGEYQAAAASFHELRKAQDAPAVRWREVAGRFHALHRRGPESARGKDALYSAALSYRQAWRSEGEWKDLSLAASVFREFAKRYSAHRLADDALMHLAGLQVQGYNDPAGALRTYRSLLEQYPAGDQALAARKKLSAIAKEVAGNQPPPESGVTAQWVPRPRKRRGAGPDLDNTATTREVQQNGDASGSSPTSPALVDAKPSGKEWEGVQFWSSPEWTRVIVTTSPGVQFNHNTIAGQGGRTDRIYLDLRETALQQELPPMIGVNDALLQKIRIGRPRAGTTRIVLDLKEIKDFQVREFVLPDAQKIVIDLFPHPSQVATLQPGPTEPAAPGKGKPDTAPDQARELSLTPSLGLKVRSIMLDPGHGGHDPGATGYGLEEKEVALDISKQLRRILLRRFPDLRIGLTRETDRFIALEQRPRIAKKFGANLFVSIHANANNIRRFHGVETYFLNPTRDASSLSVAARENATTENKISDLNAILGDLLRDSNMVESSQLARILQTGLVGKLKSHTPSIRDLGVKQAPFLVLMGAEMPSVLVETGFITNPQENRRLKSNTYLNRIAEGIYAGLQKYIEHQNLLAQRQGPPAPTGKPNL